MLTKNRCVGLLLSIGVCALLSGAAQASMIGTLDYSDTFTLNGVRTDGLRNDNSNGAYTVENSYGNTTAEWSPNGWTFRSPSSAELPYASGATGNLGDTTGFVQCGGDASMNYGVSRTNFIVSVDAILHYDRLNLGFVESAGQGIGGSNHLIVFFRRGEGIGLYNGSSETKISGINCPNFDTNWHNFAIEVNTVDNLLTFYLDEESRGTVDLNTFDGGKFANYSTNAILVGGSGTSCLDNFKVGVAGAVPEPSTAVLLLGGIAGLLAYAWRRRKIAG